MISIPLRLSSQYGLAAAARNPLAVLTLLLCLAVPARAEDPARLVALGDSLTAGYGLEQGEGLVPQLQRWLDQHGAGPVEVINMGVSGDTTAGGLARLDWALGEGADAVILELGANDMLRGIDPAGTRGNLDAILGSLAERDLPVLLIGMQSSTNYGLDFKERFDAIYPELAAEYGTLLDPFFFEGITGRPELFQADAMHPSAKGVAVVVERIGPLTLELLELVRE